MHVLSVPYPSGTAVVVRHAGDGTVESHDIIRGALVYYVTLDALVTTAEGDVVANWAGRPRHQRVVVASQVRAAHVEVAQ